MKSRQELFDLMDKFIKDSKRGISLEHFSELAGISYELFRKVFVSKELPMTARTQGAINRAWDLWDGGYVRIEQKGSQKRIRLLDTPKPLLRRFYRVEIGQNGLKLHTGIRKRSDYR